MNDQSNAPTQGELVEARGMSFGTELKAKQSQFEAALPAQIPVERFMRVVMTAIQNNPDLGRCDRRSLFTAAMKAAQDGLLPDGREGALIPYKNIVQWMPMIAGIRKKVRNSGEIKDWNAHVVHKKDNFEFELGDSPFIRHKPYLGEGDPGPVIAAYSVAHFASGEISREVMMRQEIDRVRSVSRAKDAGPWRDWFDEMARKTVARRHSKVLPMSTDLDDLIRRDDDLYDLKGASDAQVRGERPRMSVDERLDLLASGGSANADPETGEIEQISDNSSGAASPTAAPVAESRGDERQASRAGSSNDGSAQKSEPAGPGTIRAGGSAGEGGDLHSSPARPVQPPRGWRVGDDPGRDGATLEDLRREGEQRAAEGADALREFEEELNDYETELVGPIIGRLRKAAKQAGGAR